MQEDGKESRLHEIGWSENASDEMKPIIQSSAQYYTEKKSLKYIYIFLCLPFTITALIYHFVWSVEVCTIHHLQLFLKDFFLKLVKILIQFLYSGRMNSIVTSAVWKIQFHTFRLESDQQPIEKKFQAHVWTLLRPELNMSDKPPRRYYRHHVLHQSLSFKEYPYSVRSVSESMIVHTGTFYELEHAKIMSFDKQIYYFAQLLHRFIYSLTA